MVRRKRLRKSILALLMALCLLGGTVQTSTVVYATETEGEEQASDEEEQSTAEALQSAIAELPSLEDVQAMAEDSDELTALSEQVATLLADYAGLTEDEQAEVVNASVLTEISLYLESLGQEADKGDSDAEEGEETGDESEEEEPAGDKNAEGAQEEEQETKIDLAYVQNLIDSLPDADDITEENASEVEDLLDEIDKAKLSLTDEEKDYSLDYAKYAAACEALEVLYEGAASVAVAAADDDNTEKTLTVGANQTYKTVQEAINYIYLQRDQTGWTIEIESGTYLQFAIPKELDGLTVKAVDGASVTITAWTGNYDSALTATYNSTASSNSHYNTQGYQYVFNSVYVQAEDVTFNELNFTLGTYMPTEGQYWYRACITDLGGYSGGNTMSTGLTVTNCTFSSEEQGYVTTYPTGSTYNAYGILIGASTRWTVTGCTFDGFSSAICFMCDGYSVSSDGITVTGNTFTNCDRAMDGYYGGTPSGTAGTLTFSYNVVTGSSNLRSKIVVMDQVSGGSIGAVSVTGNTFTYTMVLMENMAESPCTVNDILSDNTFGTSSYYVEGDGWYYNNSYNGSITVNIPDTAYYESPESDTGYWVLNVDLDSLGSNSEGATAAVQAIIDEANLTGSHTLSITWADTDEKTLLYTVTAFKDCIYWVSTSALQIEKTVSGEASDSTDRFKFEITAPDQAGDTVTVISGTKDGTTYTPAQMREVTVGNDGVLNIWLKANEYVIIYEITSYTVEEVIDGGYTSTITSGEANGSIKIGETQVVAFSNTKDTETTIETSNEPELAKTATELDENYETTVTLTVAGSQETQKVAVLFVLDYSTSAAVRQAAEDMLQELASKDQVDLKVAVVNYNRDVEVIGWVDFDTDTTGLLDTSIDGGTNYHAGLLAAEDLLMSEEIDGYTTYLITISDGITYLWTDEITGITQSVWVEGKVDGYYVYWNNNSVYDLRYGTQTELSTERFDALVSGEIENASQYSNTVKIAEELVYGGNISESSSYVASTEYEDYLIGTEMAIYETAQSYQKLLDMVDYAYAFKKDENHWTEYPYGEQLMDYLIGLSEDGSGEITDTTATKTFSGIKNQILYTIQSGTVTDVIGNDFDLKDVKTFTMTVDGVTLTATVNGNTVNFGTADADGIYPYTVTYYPDAADGEQFVWSINVPVEMGAEITLSYVLKLVNISTTAGTYGTYDEDGSEGYSDIKTNESAELEYTPTDGDPETKPFPEPTVSYTVPETEEPTDTTETTDPTETTDTTESTEVTETSETVTEDPVEVEEAEPTVAAEVVSAVTGDNAPIGIAILLAAISEIALITLIIMQMRKKKDEVI